MRTHSRIVIAHHLVLHGYGHWLPNDPRGSGSREIRNADLSDLGPVHYGRKFVQPSREELREFSRAAAPRLDFAPLWFDDAKLWFDDAKRQAVGESIGALVREKGYTVWACAVLKNHLHLCVRRHRDDATTLWNAFAEATRDKLRLFANVADDHPVWSTRPYKVFLYTPDDVRRIVKYIDDNPEKEGLPRQFWNFVTPYDGWPHARRR